MLRASAISDLVHRGLGPARMDIANRVRDCQSLPARLEGSVLAISFIKLSDFLNICGRLPSKALLRSRFFTVENISIPKVGVTSCRHISTTSLIDLLVRSKYGNLYSSLTLHGQFHVHNPWSIDRVRMDVHNTRIDEKRLRSPLQRICTICTDVDICSFVFESLFLLLSNMFDLLCPPI